LPGTYLREAIGNIAPPYHNRQ